jgi:DNA-binding MarR family transcriptional regulator
MPDLEDLVTYRLMKLADTMGRASTQAYGARFGVTNAELRLLAVISAHQPLSANEISRRTGLDKGWVSRSMSSLLKRALVRRAPHPQDGRALLVSLTRAGKSLVERMKPFAVARQARLMEGLSHVDVDLLLTVVQQRLEAMLATPEGETA